MTRWLDILRVAVMPAATLLSATSLFLCADAFGLPMVASVMAASIALVWGGCGAVNAWRALGEGGEES